MIMQISSESVKVGHPDLVADIIAANVIAEILDGERKEKDGLNAGKHAPLRH